jgi:hypothetical protein
MFAYAKSNSKGRDGVDYVGRMVFVGDLFRRIWELLRVQLRLLLLAVILVAYIPRLCLLDDVFFRPGTIF